MCIILVKPKGEQMPSIQILKNMFNNNPDGAGVSYAINNKLYLIKGIMTLTEFLEICEKIPTKAVAVVHTRIATSGGVNKELTHPYILSNNYNTMKQLKATLNNGTIVAHNGVFNDFEKLNGVNDSMQYIKNILYPVSKKIDLLDPAIKPLINKSVSGSRLAILNNKGEIALFGEWIEDGGLYYSNTTYKPRLYYYSSSQWWEDEDEFWAQYITKLNNQQNPKTTKTDFQY